jgi:hypothetical protein
MQVELRGNADLRKALRRFAPDLEKNLKVEMKRGLAPVAKAARGFVPSNSPMSGWAGRSFSEGTFPVYNAGTIRSKIGFTTTTSKPNKRGFSTMARIFNNSRAGAIYESAGRAGADGQQWVGAKAGGSSRGVSRSTNPEAGKQFIANLPDLSGSLKGRGRLIFRAWAADKGRAEGIVNKAITTAEQELLKRSKSGSLRSAA